MSDLLYPICGEADCHVCRERTRAILENPRPAKSRQHRHGRWIDLYTEVYAEGEAPRTGWPWAKAENNELFAEVPANEPTETPNSGGVDDWLTPRKLQHSKAFERRKFPVAKRDGYRCIRCLKHLRRERRSFHHIIPRDEGGPDTEDNLVLLCGECHDWVECADPPLRNRAAIEGSFV